MPNKDYGIELLILPQRLKFLYEIFFSSESQIDKFYPKQHVMQPISLWFEHVYFHAVREVTFEITNFT